jgi:hypothetical protein
VDLRLLRGRVGRDGFALFPALDSGVLAHALARYQAQQVWGATQSFPKTG